MENTRGGSFSSFRIAACLPSIIIWSTAALQSARLLAMLGGGRMTFGSSSAARILPVLWLLVMLALPIAGYLAYRTVRGRISLIWQLAIFGFGLFALFVTLGD